LAEEYLRLNYHSFRANDKTFNSKMKIISDENIGKINIVPQDNGRVSLNLFNYALGSKKKKRLEAMNLSLQ
jgi:hypothetical protein